MNRQIEIEDILKELESRCPSGYALALHIRFTTPGFLFQTYPNTWIDRYSERGYVMQDPTVRWGFENTGQTRWSDLQADDVVGVLADAADHGLGFGACYVTDAGDSRSVTSFARNDREFHDDEIAELVKFVDHLHQRTAELSSLSPETAEELRKMSVRFTHPGTSGG